MFDRQCTEVNKNIEISAFLLSALKKNTSIKQFLRNIKKNTFILQKLQLFKNLSEVYNLNKNRN